jgi:hypothetical protein
MSGTEKLATAPGVRINEVATLQAGGHDTRVAQRRDDGKRVQHDVNEIRYHDFDVAPVVEHVPQVRSVVDIGSQHLPETGAMLGSRIR